MVEIKEMKRDSSLDYIKILRALNEIPFPVGKNLLYDFLIGNYKNSSIKKNNLDELYNFGSLLWEKEKICSWIDKLIHKKMIEQTGYENNRFAKVLKITLKGKNEIVKPTLNKEEKIKLNFNNAEITQQDKILFEKYNDFLKYYNNEQKKAIITDKKSVLTIAGAGTGKTTVLVKRIEFLVKYKNVNPEEILAITFTRKAREEMQERLKTIGIENVNIATFNSFCEQILRKHGREFYGRSVRVLTYADKLLAMNLALYNLNLELEELIKLYFSKSKQQNKTPAQLQSIFLNDCFSLLDYFKLTGQEIYNFSKDTGPSEKQMAQILYKIIKYIFEHKKTQGLRDFSDQLVDVITFFKKKPMIIPYYEHILVDEYQDVNSLQVELLNLINFDNIFAVGDPRQSIFGWRGSDINFILSFDKDFGESQVIHLTKNYRSNKKIVDFINKSIIEMSLPDLKEHKQDQSEIKIFSFENEDAEKSFITQIIEDFMQKKETIFILSRTNRQILELSDLLKRKKIRFLLKTDEFNANTKNIENFSLVLATVHSIKGLEADNVFLIGANTDSFPCRASDHPILELIKSENYDKDQEEKRLFYVALSRAKKNLYITYSGSKTNFITTDMESIL